MFSCSSTVYSVSVWQLLSKGKHLKNIEKPVTLKTSCCLLKCLVLSLLWSFHGFLVSSAQLKQPMGLWIGIYSKFEWSLFLLVFSFFGAGIYLLVWPHIFLMYQSKNTFEISPQTRTDLHKPEAFRLKKFTAINCHKCWEIHMRLVLLVTCLWFLSKTLMLTQSFWCDWRASLLGD